MKICIFILASTFFFLADCARAAEVFIEPNAYLKNNERFYEIKVFLNAQGENINALQGEMKYSADDLDFQKTTEGGSVVGIWLESPQKSSEGKIIFSGGIPGGYSGSKGFLFSAIFRIPSSSAVENFEISFENLKMYLNDGLGTEKSIDASGIILELEEIKIATEVLDEDPPEAFAPYVAQDPNLEDGQWVVIMNGQDNGEGIDYYEIYESDEKHDMGEILADGSIIWRRADGTNSYFLLGQSLKNYIYVKAVDKAGNERVILINPTIDNIVKAFDYKLFSAIIVLIIIVVILGFEFSIRRKAK